MRRIPTFLLLGPMAAAGCSSTQAEFPPVDMAKVEITLARSACYGECPDYQVRIHGDGRVRFSTEDNPFGPAGETPTYPHFVRHPGTHEYRIDPSLVWALIDRFRAASFFSLKDEYRSTVTDNPTYRLTLDLGASSKTVTDYAGAGVGMPKSVTELEDAVDTVANSKQWIEGTGGNH